MNIDNLIDECEALGRRYIEACRARGHAQGRLDLDPSDPKKSRARFDAGMAEDDAFRAFVARTASLAASGESRTCADLRFDVLQAGPIASHEARRLASGLARGAA